jgi:hypothetical protein
MKPKLFLLAAVIDARILSIYVLCLLPFSPVLEQYEWVLVMRKEIFSLLI